MVDSIIGKSVEKADAVAKVTGQAKYTGDLWVRGALVGKILRSPHAHALVKNIDISRAQKLPGVKAVITHIDVPPHVYATAGHPFSLDPKHGDVADKTILTGKARYVGDEIAAVATVDEITAIKALKLIEVKYELYEPVLSSYAALREGAPLVHAEKGSNLISSAGYQIGDVEDVFKKADIIVTDEIETSIVQHCALENHTSCAYLDADGRIIIVTSTQIPHICRRIVGQALGIPWGRVRIIKPYVGGGFGGKQDVCLEPLNAVLSMAAGGKPVKIELTREESMIGTRTRHSVKYQLKTGVRRDGKLMAIQIDAVSNTGAYASHGHAIMQASGTKLRYLYSFEAMKYSPRTVYTNLPPAGAMRGYGSPQLTFAIESHLDNIASRLEMDPTELRTINLRDGGYKDSITGNQVYSCGINDCIKRGKEELDWDAKRTVLKNNNSRRRGLGMACFSYGTGTYPAGQELAGARIIMNQDGSVQMQVGATDVGQGSDTVLAQMAAETIGIPYESVYVMQKQDTDLSPYDPGCYASRQTYITGMAVRKAALEMIQKILEYAETFFGLPADSMDIIDANLVEKSSGRIIAPLSELALHSYYNRNSPGPISIDVTNNAHLNAISFGATFAEVEVDLKTGMVDIIRIINIHDSGVIINRVLAEGQVHGGVSMAIGYALSENMIFEKTTGKPLNNNFLDYKLPTILDTPSIDVDFVKTYEPTGPYGNKSLGEPPTLAPAPAIRNAIYNATGIAFNRIPINPQYAYEKFMESGLLD